MPRLLSGSENSCRDAAQGCRSTRGTRRRFRSSALGSWAGDGLEVAVDNEWSIALTEDGEDCRTDRSDRDEPCGVVGIPELPPLAAGIYRRMSICRPRWCEPIGNEPTAHRDAPLLVTVDGRRCRLAVEVPDQQRRGAWQRIANEDDLLEGVSHRECWGTVKQAHFSAGVEATLPWSISHDSRLRGQRVATATDGAVRSLDRQFRRGQHVRVVRLWNDGSSAW